MSFCSLFLGSKSLPPLLMQSCLASHLYNNKHQQMSPLIVLSDQFLVAEDMKKHLPPQLCQPGLQTPWTGEMAASTSSTDTRVGVITADTLWLLLITYPGDSAGKRICSEGYLIDKDG